MLKNKLIAKKNRGVLLFLAFSLMLFLAALFCPQGALAASDRLVDAAGVLSSGEASKIGEKLDKTSAEYGVDVVILTVASLEGSTATEFADDYYDYGGYADNGVLFLISTGDRQWAISTKGTCIGAFTDAGQEYIANDVKGYLSDGDYGDALNKFADYADDYLKHYRDGKPYDTGNLPKKPFKGIRDGIISLLGGLGIGWGRAAYLKSQTKTVKEAKNATGYLTNSVITQANDILVHREFHRIERSSGGGGGSTTHTSSSGATHGGSSGSF